VEALSPDYLIALGDMLQLKGLYEEAIGKYEAACDLRPRNAQYLVRLAQAHAAVYDLTNAEHALRKAIAVDPQCTMAFDALGQVLLDGGQYETAIKDCFLPLIDLFPKTESYYFKVAIAYTELGVPEKAAEFLGETIAKGMGSAAFYYDLAWTSVRASRKYDGEAHQTWIEKGIKALCKAVDLDASLRRRAADDQDFDDVRGSPLFPVGRGLIISADTYHLGRKPLISVLPYRDGGLIEHDRAVFTVSPDNCSRTFLVKVFFGRSAEESRYSRKRQAWLD
jgi:tetratricopeptide (TPR) repeat protein